MRHINYILLLFIILSACHKKKEEKDGTQSLTEQKEKAQIVKEVDQGMPESEIVVFVLHRFNDQRFPSTSISTKKLKEIFEYLKSENIQVVSASEAVDLVYDNQADTIRRVVFTVDDGYQSFYTDGYPLFENYGFPVTLFVNTESVGWSDYLGWDQLKELTKKGVEIGNHSHSHAHMLTISHDTSAFFKHDLKKAHTLLAERLAFKGIYAYPYGEHLEPFHRWLREEGYIAAFSQQSGVFHEQSNRYCIPRFPLNDALAEMAAVKEKVNMNALRVDMNCQVGLQKSEKPALIVVMKEKGLRMDQLQCFTGGGRCSITMNGNTVALKANSPLKGRRNKYTLTAPDNKGKWHWFSYVFVNTEVPEN
jgi:peptidoglycan/xylan/chitin deacetylase (PgdA/CDA1 family)